MASHTPGPWHYGILSGSVDGARGCLIADLNDRPDELATKADGQLIAAAPDLLAACQAVERAQRGGDYGVAFDMVRAAIAMAEGVDNG